MINFKTGVAQLNVYQSFKNGEEYDYSYITTSHKHFFLFNYGFYDNSSIHQSILTSTFTLEKSEFTFHKYTICKKIQCINEMDIDFFYTDVKLQSIIVEFRLNQRKLNKKMIGVMRLLSLSSTEITDISHIVESITRGRWINYKNEIAAYMLFRKNLIDNNLSNKKLDTYNIIKIAGVTRGYYKKNKKRIDGSLRLKNKYRKRDNIFKVMLEYRRIVNKNLKMANKEVFKIMKDQFSKIKNHYMKDEWDEDFN